MAVGRPAWFGRQFHRHCGMSLTTDGLFKSVNVVPGQGREYSRTDVCWKGNIAF